MSDEYDSPWKEMLEIYFYDFLAFFFAKIHREVDWNRGYENDNPQWRPESFGWELWDCRMSLRFPSVKLRDYNERWLELESNTNVFATLVMAHLKTRGTRKDPEERLVWKMRLVRRLYKVGYGRRDVLELF